MKESAKSQHEVDKANFAAAKAFVETLKKFGNKGYKAINATLRFVVAWKGENNEEETPVVMANIELHSS